MKTTCTIPFYHLLTVILAIATTSGASASTVTRQDTGQSALVRSSEAGVHDALVVNSPNAQGVSVNHYTQFSVDKPLSLVSLGNGNTAMAADVIVIQAPNILIKDQITLVGPKADVIFVGTGSGAAITCTPCDMRQTLRTVLAAAEPVTLVAGEVGTLTTRSGSHIHYSAIKTPGAIALELVSDRLVSSGGASISTMESARQHANGGYVADENGSLLMGGGAVNFSLGHLSWDFASQSATAFKGPIASGNEQLINGHILSTMVSVNSAHPLSVGATIDTRSALLSSFRYQNRVVVNQEQVNFSVFYGDHPVRVYGRINTQGEMTLRSNGNIDLYRSGYAVPVFEVGTLNAMARKAIDTRATVLAESIQMAGQSIINQHVLQGLSTVELFAESSITNQGDIAADRVMIESESGTFLNGFRGGMGAQELQPDVEHYQSSNPSRRGLAFDPSVSATATYTSIQAAASVTAHNLHIKVKNLENINPYYAKDTNADGVVDLDTHYFDQVRLSAENQLFVSASGYIVNASAVIEQNSPQGALRMAAGLFVNDRYLVYSGLARYSSTDTNPSLSITSNVLISETAVYSPPGRIVFFGPGYIGAAQGIINHASYIEGFNNAELFTEGNLSDIGIQHQQIGQTEEVNHALRGGCWSDRSCERLDYSFERILAEDLHSMDSLLFVQGNALGESARLQLMTVKPFEYYQLQAIQQKQQQVFNGRFTFGTTHRHYAHEVHENVVVIRAYESFRKVTRQYFDCEAPEPGFPRETYCNYRDIVSYEEKQVGQDVSLSRYTLMQEYQGTSLQTHNTLMQRIR